MSAVSDWLEQARVAHLQYRAALPQRVNGQITAGDPAAADRALWQACRARVEAEALDPQHVDLAWANEPQYPHDALLTFYGVQLSQ